MHGAGDPWSVLQLDDVEVPSPGPRQLAVRVGGATLNFADILMCQGSYQQRPEHPFTPGMEFAGGVVAVGAGVDGELVGRRVAGMCEMPHGGFAEQALTAVDAAFPLTDNVDDVVAAALVVAYQTGWFALHRRGRLQPGETLLVHAGAGGVGSAAIQLGVAAGARVLATAGGPDKVAICLEQGASHAIDSRSEDIYQRVMELTEGGGVDVVYDPVGGDLFDVSRRLLAWEGRLLVIGFAGGSIPAAPANHVLVKNYSVVGVHWGGYLSRDLESVRACHTELLGMLERGQIAPLVSETIGLDDVPDALHRLYDRGTTGRVVMANPSRSGGAV
jgi:NADPH:quinone reductase